MYWMYGFTCIGCMHNCIVGMHCDCGGLFAIYIIFTCIWGIFVIAQDCVRVTCQKQHQLAVTVCDQLLKQHMYVCMHIQEVEPRHRHRHQYN